MIRKCAPTFRALFKQHHANQVFSQIQATTYAFSSRKNLPSKVKDAVNIEGIKHSSNKVEADSN